MLYVASQQAPRDGNSPPVLFQVVARLRERRTVTVAMKPRPTSNIPPVSVKRVGGAGVCHRAVWAAPACGGDCLLAPAVSLSGAEAARAGGGTWLRVAASVSDISRDFTVDPRELRKHGCLDHAQAGVEGRLITR